MNSPAFHSLRLLLFGGMVTLLCNMSVVAQAPKRTTVPTQTPAAPNRYMATITRFHRAIGSGDLKTIIDLSYFCQRRLKIPHFAG
jgi:hypothetical protein